VTDVGRSELADPREAGLDLLHRTELRSAAPSPADRAEAHQMKADAKTTADVQATVKKFTDAYQARNLRDLMDCFVPDADVVVYGTGADEKRVGPEQVRAQVERDWAQSDSIALSFGWSSISAAGQVAWVAMDGSFTVRAGGSEMTVPARVSLVLENRAGRWLIAHSHFSTPAAGQAEGKSF
jgi:ketosteroid isomerase-like protein